MEKQLVVRPENLPAIIELPEEGLGVEKVKKLLLEYAEMDNVDVMGGKVSGAVYNVDSSIQEVSLEAFKYFAYSNPLHPDVFKSVRKLEAEVVSMTVKMFNGDEMAVGTMTAGGTESILLACKAYRDQARQERGISFPELIAPVTAHAAFEKAAHYFGIKLVQVPVDLTTGQGKVQLMRSHINCNTIALVCSAPNFSLGVMDNVEEIASLAKEFNVGCHVDCCLGSFILPQLGKMGHKSVTPFDFRVEGVTSISCDPHKYGFSPKGASVIMYRSMSLRQYQYFISTEWTGGIYATPTLLGSRSGGVVAATWATMMLMGQEGYQKAAIQISEMVNKIFKGIEMIPELFIFGQPTTGTIAFGSRTLNIYAINDEMSLHGWHLNALQNPPAVHMTCTMLTSKKTVDLFLHDLTEAVKAIRSQPSSFSHSLGTAAIYGSTATAPDKSIVEDFAKVYIDTLYKL